MRKHFLTALFLLLYYVSFAQDRNRSVDWLFIDSSIANNRNLLDIKDLVQKTKNDLLLQKKYLQAARCYYYEVKIADKRTEDSLYFRNSAIYDSLLMTNTTPRELQLAIHILLAKRLSWFTIKNLKFKQFFYEDDKLPINYARFSDAQLNYMALEHYEKASKMLEGQSYPTADVLWFSSDPLMFLYPPDFFDIIISEQILLRSKGQNINKSLDTKSEDWSSLSQDEFIAKIDSASVTNYNTQTIFKLYSDWFKYRYKEKEKYYFIETLARKFYEGGYDYSEEELKPGYVQYLSTISRSPYTTVRAHGIYQLCLFWNKEGKKYFPLTDEELRSRSIYNRYRSFDTTRRYLLAKAYHLYDQNRSMMDSFSYLNRILQKMERQILKTEINIVLNSRNLPGQPMLAEMIFKNVDTLYYQIIKVPHSFLLKSDKHLERVNAIREHESVREEMVVLPSMTDFNRHSTYVKMESLAVGEYYLVFSHHPISYDNKELDFLKFQVSSLAVVQNISQLFVLDAKTGMPINGARVKGTHFTGKKDGSGKEIRVVKEYKTNAKGYTSITDSRLSSFDISFRGDTTFRVLNIEEEDPLDNVYDKEEYDDLVEFYEENAEAYVYTDRSIYRPGQTVYYKAIFLTKDPTTGETILMNPKNLGNSLFKRVYKKWIKESEPYLSITDPFSKEVDSIPITLNEFGSFSGTYKIPKTAATGEWDIDPDYVEGGHSAIFKVEEYKRPSYELKIEGPKKQLLPGDSILFKIKVKSFAGAQLNNVRVRYTVVRGGLIPGETPRYITDTIINEDGFTNENGELQIVANDEMLRKMVFDESREWSFKYNVDVETIDQTGETYSEDFSLNVSTRPITIRSDDSGPINLSKNNGMLLRTRDIIEGNVGKNLKVEIYRIEQGSQPPTSRELVDVDAWLYNKEELQKLFPHINFERKRNKEAERKLIQTISINTGASEKIKLDNELYSAGDYVLNAICIENGKLIGKNEMRFSLFDEEKKLFPSRTFSFKYSPVNSLYTGDTVRLYNGNSEGPVYSIWQVRYYGRGKKTAIIDKFEYAAQSAGMNCWKWKIPKDAFEKAKIFQGYVYNNEYYEQESEIYITSKNEPEPEIIVEKYRKKMAPGARETFSVSIKTSNENVAAELMTTLYDASLDKLEKHNWRLPNPHSYRPPDDNWSWEANSPVGKQVEWAVFREFRDDDRTSLEMPLWWIDPFYISEGDVMGDWNSFGGRRNYARGFSTEYADQGEVLVIGSSALMSKVPGLSEVVITGYSTMKKELSGAIAGVRIRGSASLGSYANYLIILDGKPFEGELNNIDATTIVAGLILKGADATALYGARAAGGVLILSTKGEIVLPELIEPSAPSRKNFNELAFFFPTIHADKHGYYSFIFTMPESVTEWNWKLLAHTKSAKFAYAERQLNTQLPLMVQPNIPRLLYQGDKIVIQNRISNLDSVVSIGVITCKVEDIVTGEDISSKFLGSSQKSYTIEPRSTKSVGFEITVPKEQINPIKLIVNVRSPGFADGEEHVLPILNPRVFVKQVQPFYLVQKDSLIATPTLQADAVPFGVGLSIRPKPQAALINSLPYLSEYSFDCAEQVTNKIRALLTATQIIRTDSAARQSYEQAKLKMEKVSPDSLPDQLSEETMPWLNFTNYVSKQQEKLFRLFDSSKTEKRVEAHLEKLYKLQKPDGGLAWFPGGNSNLYISQYVLGGFGQMKDFDMLQPPGSFAVDFNKFIEKLVGYCDMTLFEPGLRRGDDLVNIITSRSRWKKKYPISEIVQKRIDSVLLKEWQTADNKHLSRQASLILASLLNAHNGEIVNKANTLLRSISQLAITDDQNGVRWKDIADADFMDGTTEETLAMLAESYQLTDTNSLLTRGIIKWLSNTRTEEHWSSTKATAAVVNLLRSETGNITSSTIDVTATIKNSDKISVSNDMLSGSLFDVRQVNTFPTKIKVERTHTEAIAGNLIWYYFGTSQVANNGVILRKLVHKFNRENNNWEIVNDNTVLKIADQLRVSLEIETRKPLTYVYIDDKRAAGLEPVVNNSDYEYSPFAHYRSVRDAGMQFFIDYLPSGQHTISYEVKAAHEGSFMNGPASLQCMYRPDLNAMSNSLKVTVK